MKKLNLINKNGKYEAVVNPKSETVMLQVKGATVLSILISVDGITYVEHTSNINITNTDIVNIVNAKFMMYLKIQSTNNVEIKILD